MGAATTVRVMCVDDNEEILSALGDHFGRTGGIAIVGTLCNTTGLVEAVKDFKPDILVLDLDMPGRNPLDVLEEVNAASEATRTVVFSGHIRNDLVDRAMDAGAWGYVSKNDGEVFLLDAIRAIMEGKIAWSPEVRAVIGRG